jgi:hypothetical protein
MSKTYTKAYFKKDYSILNTQGKTCILLISVGQRYHEGEKLSSTISLINQSKFMSCHIVVADTLQRHNAGSNYNSALKSGSDWIERNMPIINQLQMKYQIIRWDTCLNANDYHHYKNMIEKEYYQNSVYNAAINNTISYFLDRNKASNPNFNEEKEFDSCLTYLLEECPIIMPMWAKDGYDFIIYPKQQTEAMNATYKLFVENKYPEKAKWLALRFKEKFLKEIA